jgi:hypothetical protein
MVTINEIIDSKILLITISLTIGYYYIQSDDNNLILKKDI